MYPDAEFQITEAARSQRKEEELRLWKERYTKCQNLAAWYSKRPSTLVVPGGYEALEVMLIKIQRNNPNLFASITPDELLLRVDHFHRDVWRHDPATERQLQLLRSKGINITATITKGEASDLIDQIVTGPSEGQCRRLSFYGLDVPTTRDEASEMIDGYIEDHPEAEALYQDWKRSNGIQ